MATAIKWRVVLASLLLGAAPATSRAADSVCWIVNGVVLVPAVAAGLDGLFILDTGAATSQIDATQASEVDIGAAAIVGDVTIAGRLFPKMTLKVLALDARTRDFPLPVAGVLGSDLLAGRVLEIQTDPCRLSIVDARRLRARPEKPAFTAPVTLQAGVPYVQASISDGTRTRIEPFRIATGSDRAIVLGGRTAHVLGAAPGAEATDPAILRAMAVAGALMENPPATVFAGSAPSAIGEPVWSRYRMRLDYANRILTLTPK